MNGLTILLFLIFVLLAVTLIVGLIILRIAQLKKDKEYPTKKTGQILISIPLTVFAIYILYYLAHNNFTEKPTDKDLVGTYHIVDASGLIPSNLYNSYSLEFKEDSTFVLTRIPNVNVCENGQYSVDWELDYNEISFQCGKGFTTAHIDRGFSRFKIEFIIGDPDSGQSIFFSKDK
jgi:hypothetical protein